MKRRALVSGISSQDGIYLAELLLSRDYEVHGTVRRSSNTSLERAQHLRDRVQLHEADLLDPLSIIEAVRSSQPHEVYNLAAQSFIPLSWRQPLLTSEFTGLGVTRVLEAVRLVDPSIRFYQAGSSEMFGLCRSEPQDESTPFHPRTPYGVAKAYAHWMVVNYRETYGMFACSGILYNHESPLRSKEFVSRKITDAVARIKFGLQRELRLGNLDGQRDWGFAGDYVRSMWLMLQRPQPADYVIATGVKHSVREMVELAFARAGLDWQEHVVVDPTLFRPTEANTLRGDYRKAREELGWKPAVSFQEMIEMMVDADLDRVQRELAQGQSVT
jgi:GDPmannose 4,6-dehydratase